jgi:hypothetical protein
MTGLAQWVLCVLSIPVAAAYVCRFGLLDITQHRLAYIALHIGLFGAAVDAGVKAWQLDAGLPEALALAAAGAWLSISLHTWGRGVPPQAYRHRPPEAEVWDTTTC